MAFIITLIGQDNVGKSTLFNRLTTTNHSLTSDYLGLTRDRKYGYLMIHQLKVIIVDTGGITGTGLFKKKIELGIKNFINYQTGLAIKEADLILFIVDRQSGKSILNRNIISFLRKEGKDIFILINKVDYISYYIQYMICSYYYSFGVKTIIPISAINGYGVTNLLDKIFSKIPKNIVECVDEKNKYLFYSSEAFIKHHNSNDLLILDKTYSPIKLGVIGRPNSGKSTLINRILGTTRVVTCDTPGTTRDSIHIPIVFNSKQYILIDTAGIRKIYKINNQAEQISIARSFQVIKEVHVILFLIDANIGISHQDLSLLKFIINNGNALVILINKWDMLSIEIRRKVKQILYEKIKFLDFVKVHFISALYGSGISNIFKSVQKAYVHPSNFIGNNRKHSIINTSQLTYILNQSIIRHPPPLLGKIRIKPKYVHIGGYNPLILIIHGISVSKLPIFYQQYLKRCFYQALHITGAVMHIRLKDAVNPFFNK